MLSSLQRSTERRCWRVQHGNSNKGFSSFRQDKFLQVDGSVYIWGDLLHEL